VGLIPSRVLCQFLRIPSATLSHWKKEGFLCPFSYGQYDEADVNAFLMKHSVNFNSPLTWRAVREGKISLLSTEEVTTKFGVDHSRVRILRTQNLIAYICYPGKRGRYFYDEESIARVCALPKLYFATQLEHIIGCAIRNLVHTGELKLFENPLDRHNACVSDTELIAFLEKRLPGWVEPKSWINERLNTDKPLVPLTEAIIELGASKRGVYDELNARRVRYIRSGIIRVSPAWLKAHFEVSHPLSAEQVAKIYDVGFTTAAGWGDIECPISAHDHSTLYSLRLACWIAILQETSSPGYEDTMPLFVRQRLNARDWHHLLTLTEAAQWCKCSKALLAELAQQGKILGIRTPDGDWRFTKYQLLAARKQMGI
jgi:hypothetical protein